MSQSPLNLPLYLSVCLSCVAIGFHVKGDNNNEPEEEEEEAVRQGAIMSIGEYEVLRKGRSEEIPTCKAPACPFIPQLGRRQSV